MSLTVRFEREADDEYQDSIGHLEGARTGLGEIFRADVERTLRKVVADPFRFRRVRGDVRKVYVPRFKHWIYFLIEKKEIVVAAVFHTSRDPESLRERGLL